jgi:peptidoglycan-N-acetylglucosamine deacetylase
LTYYAVRGKSSQIFGRSVYKGPGHRRVVALTFDDGPSPGTLDLLDYFDEQNVRASFFMCGKNTQREGDIARAVAESGHEIGNHTFSHARLPPRIGWQVNWRSPAFIEDEIARTQNAIEEAAGVRPVLFRAPYGYRWYGLGAAQRRHGLLGVMWTVIAHDWEWPAEKISAHVLARTNPGGILCFHDGRDTRPQPDISETLKSIKSIVPVLKDQGYRFETVSGLLSNVSLE